jgi:uncharacterized protein (TIGR02466 family)
MPNPPRNPNIQHLWPTLVLKKKFGQYQKVNQELLDLFYEHRRKNEKTPAPVYASRDNLYEEYKDNSTMGKLIKFIMDNVFEVAGEANGKYWGRAQNIDVEITGIWFQMSNDGGFHETHIHGNCSWSGVYYVQVDGCSQSANDRKDGLMNGITRFYGHHMEAVAGGHCEFGNVYLNESMSWDSYPENGVLVVFPSHIKHMVFPYKGEKDRVIVSFHARVHGETDLTYNYEFV